MFETVNINIDINIDIKLILILISMLIFETIPFSQNKGMLSITLILIGREELTIRNIPKITQKLLELIHLLPT